MKWYIEGLTLRNRSASREGLHSFVVYFFGGLNGYGFLLANTNFGRRSVVFHTLLPVQSSVPTPAVRLHV